MIVFLKSISLYQRFGQMKTPEWIWLQISVTPLHSHADPDLPSVCALVGVVFSSIMQIICGQFN